MLRYTIKRLLLLIPVILGVTFLVFTLLHFTPGDPARAALGTNATEEMLDAWREERGLNEPFLKQFLTYVGNVFLKGDFGKSYTNSISIGDEIRARLPISIRLALLAILVNFVVGTPIGILSAVRRYTVTDNIVMFIALFLVSMPGFWVALELSIIFALKLRLLPASGLYGPQYYILPVAALSMGGIAAIVRMTRSCMLDVVNQDYIVTAKAKGVAEQPIIFKHALKNALIPIITQIGGSAAGLVGGAMIIEIVFAIPGMGSYMMSGITGRDYPVVLGSVIVLSLFACIILLVTDLAYALVDPRIRAQFGGKKIRKKEA